MFVSSFILPTPSSAPSRGTARVFRLLILWHRTVYFCLVFFVMHVILFSLYYMFSARRFPPLATVGCATFQFSCWLSAVGLAPPATMVACGRVLILVSLVLAPVFSFNSPFFVSPPHHADGTREGFDGRFSCHSAFSSRRPPPHWRYATGF